MWPPGIEISVLATNSDGLQPTSFLLLAAMPFVPSSCLFLHLAHLQEKASKLCSHVDGLPPLASGPSVGVQAPEALPHRWLWHRLQYRTGVTFRSTNESCLAHLFGTNV